MFFRGVSLTSVRSVVTVLLVVTIVSLIGFVAIVQSKAPVDHARAQTTSDGRYQALDIRQTETNSRIFILDTSTGKHWVISEKGADKWGYSGPSELPGK